jgi:hypothetical protein
MVLYVAGFTCKYLTEWRASLLLFPLLMLAVLLFLPIDNICGESGQYRLAAWSTAAAACLAVSAAPCLLAPYAPSADVRGAVGFVCYGLAVSLVWMRTLQFFLVHKGLGQFVRVLVNMTSDLRAFSLVWAVFLFTFGTALLATGAGGDLPPPGTATVGDPSDPTTPMQGWGMWWLVRTLLQSMGHDYIKEMDSHSSSVVFILMWPVFQILLVNLLIAVMNDRYEDSKAESGVDYVLSLYRYSRNYKLRPRTNPFSLLWNLGCYCAQEERRPTVGSFAGGLFSFTRGLTTFLVWLASLLVGSLISFLVWLASLLVGLASLIRLAFIIAWLVSLVGSLASLFALLASSFARMTSFLAGWLTKPRAKPHAKPGTKAPRAIWLAFLLDGLVDLLYRLASLLAWLVSLVGHLASFLALLASSFARMTSFLSGWLAKTRAKLHAKQGARAVTKSPAAAAAPVSTKAASAPALLPDLSPATDSRSRALAWLRGFRQFLREKRSREIDGEPADAAASAAAAAAAGPRSSSSVAVAAAAAGNGVGRERKEVTTDEEKVMRAMYAAVQRREDAVAEMRKIKVMVPHLQPPIHLSSMHPANHPNAFAVGRCAGDAHDQGVKPPSPPPPSPGPPAAHLSIHVIPRIPCKCIRVNSLRREDAVVQMGKIKAMTTIVHSLSIHPVGWTVHQSVVGFMFHPSIQLDGSN